MAHEPDISSLIPGFLDEVSDRLDALERVLDGLDDATGSPMQIGQVVAALHTIKGSASCLSLLNLAESAHRAESIVEPWRADGCVPSPDALRSLRGAVADVRALSESLTLGAAPTRSPDEITGHLPLRDVFEHHGALTRARAAEIGRDVSLEIHLCGEPVVDHAVARLLCPVLLHTLNNCVDHAAEPPEARKAAGKPPVTAIMVDGHVRPDGRLALTITDDGPGIDREAIARRAVALGWSPPADPAGVDDDTLQKMIFRPGVSTTVSPSIRAGRGVGLEAVRLAIADLGGSVRVLSTPGRGTTVTFLIPVLNRSGGNTDTGSESADAA